MWCEIRLNEYSHSSTYFLCLTRQYYLLQQVSSKLLQDFRMARALLAFLASLEADDTYEIKLAFGDAEVLILLQFVCATWAHRHAVPNHTGV